MGNCRQSALVDWESSLSVPHLIIFRAMLLDLNRRNFMKTSLLFLFCLAVLCSSAQAVTPGNTCAVHYDRSLPLDTSACTGVLSHRPPTLAKCEIDFNNPEEPLMTYPWNAFLCGYNSQGWVWLVSIDKLSDTN